MCTLDLLVIRGWREAGGELGGNSIYLPKFRAKSEGLIEVIGSVSGDWEAG